uniref:Uncharacterized protein n=1 Tax=Cyprinus carpio TaxID=7962 RepID=A0A8C2KY81_CYPCA
MSCSFCSASSVQFLWMSDLCLFPQCAESLTRTSTALTNTANKRERVKILHKKIEDLLKYLDPQFTDFIAVPDAVKLEFILAGECSDLRCRSNCSLPPVVLFIVL